MTGTSCRPDLILLRGRKPSTSRPDDQERKQKKTVTQKGKLKKQRRKKKGLIEQKRLQTKSRTGFKLIRDIIQNSNAFNLV